MSEEIKHKKILICGHGGEGLEAAERLLLELNNTEVIIVKPEEIQKRGIIISKLLPKIESPIIKIHYIPKYTRAERRAKNRKKQK